MRTKGRHKGFTETDHTRLLDGAQQQPGGPAVPRSPAGLAKTGLDFQPP
ncbi:hypothetical protein [Streptomyces sp. NPDC088350]